jgi:hypothetical protein
MLGVFSRKTSGPFPHVPNRQDHATSGIVPTKEQLSQAAEPNDNALVHPAKMK